MCQPVKNKKSGAGVNDGDSLVTLNAFVGFTPRE